MVTTHMMIFCFLELCQPKSVGEKIFHSLDSYISDKGIQWENCVGFCLDGVLALTGRHSGVISKIREVAADMNFIHSEAMASKEMSPEFKTVLDNAVKLDNYIMARR